MEAVDLLAALGGVAWTALTWAWGVVWVVLQGLFWLIVIGLAYAIVVRVFRPQTATVRNGAVAGTSTPTLEAIRVALRSGELDAEIARINARNAARSAR